MKIPGVRKITKLLLVAPLRVVQGANDAFGEYLGDKPKKEGRDREATD